MGHVWPGEDVLYLANWRFYEVQRLHGVRRAYLDASRYGDDHDEPWRYRLPFVRWLVDTCRLSEWR